MQLDWLEKKRGIFSAKNVKDTIRVALPAQFNGTGDEWSPEHLFLGSISSCFMTTLFVFADKMSLEISHYQCECIGEIEIVDGKYEFTTINMYPKISIPNGVLMDKAAQVLEKTQKYCLVANSVKTRISYHSEILNDKVLLHKHTPESSGL